MNKDNKYEIIISTGEFDSDYLEAEIYNDKSKYICSISYNGKENIIDVTSLSKEDFSVGRKISLKDLVDGINEAMKELNLSGTIIYDAHRK